MADAKLSSGLQLAGALRKMSDSSGGLIRLQWNFCGVILLHLYSVSSVVPLPEKNVSFNSMSLASKKHLYILINMPATNYYVMRTRLTRLTKIAAYFFIGLFFINMRGSFAATNIYGKC